MLCQEKILSLHVSALKPFYESLVEESTGIAEDDNTVLAKERVKVDLELRYLNSEFDYLLELSSFLDPGFKLNYVNNRAKVLEKIENKKSLSQLIKLRPLLKHSTIKNPHFCIGLSNYRYSTHYCDSLGLFTIMIP